MRLSGACSNQSQLAVVLKAAEARSKLTTSNAAKSSRAPIRLKQGILQDAVLTVMAENRQALRPTEIRASVERKLGRTISYDTVASFLSAAARSDRWPVVRVSPGRYRLLHL